MNSIKISGILFGLVGSLSLVFGLLYLIWPLAPYHEQIMGIEGSKIALTEPIVYKLLVTLVDVVGLAFLALGIFVIWLGYQAWNDRGAWLTLLLVFFVFTLPMCIVVGLVGGPLGITVLVACLTALALGLARSGR